ncbi:MAG: hypothetical protein ACRD6B_06425, partial [Bryobacteraceae bacterium]
MDTKIESPLTRREFAVALSGAAVAAGTVDAKGRRESKRRVYLVPNFHPASCGWLTTFSKERMYC